MARRTMREHDVVIVDYSDLNAIAIVTDRSEDPKITQGIGGPGVPAFRLQYVAWADDGRRQGRTGGGFHLAQ